MQQDAIDAEFGTESAAGSEVDQSPESDEYSDSASETDRECDDESEEKNHSFQSNSNSPLYLDPTQENKQELNMEERELDEKIIGEETDEEDSGYPQHSNSYPSVESEDELKNSAFFPFANKETALLYFWANSQPRISTRKLQLLLDILHTKNFSIKKVPKSIYLLQKAQNNLPSMPIS